MPGELSTPSISDAEDAELAAYHPVSKLAVVGFFWGLLTATALVDPFLWFVPAVGILVNALALWLVARRAPGLLGRRMALAGLMLSVVFGVAGPTQWYGFQLMLAREARQVADAWFTLLCHGDVWQAHQLTRHPDYREPPGPQLKQRYEEDPAWRAELEEFRQKPLIGFLEAWREKALARFYLFDGTDSYLGQPVVFLRYAISFDDRGRRKSFLVRLGLRRVERAGGAAGWVVRISDNAVSSPG